MSRTSIALAAVLILLGLALPVHATAAFLVGGGSAMLATVQNGVWCLKGMLLLHAAILIIIPRLGLKNVRGTALASFADEPFQRASRWELATLAAILLVALLLRLYDLPNGLWFDEIQTLVDYVRLPMGRVLTTYDSQNQHLLYSVLARCSISIFGESAGALRLPAAVFGVASVWAVYYFARLITGRAEALLAAAFLAFSYHHVWFSQNARGYTGLLLWTLLASAAFIRMVTGRYRHPWGVAIVYGLCMGLAAYTHITAVIVSVAHFLIWVVLLFRMKQRPRGFDAWLPGWGILFAATITLQLYAIVLPQMFATVLHPPRGAAQTAWQSPLWFLTESLRGLGEGIPGGWITLALGLVVIAAGIISYWKRTRAGLVTMLLPAVLSGLALIALKHNLWPRFFFFSAGFGVLILIRGGYALVEWLLPPRFRVLAPVGTILVICASAITVPKAWGPKQDYTGASTFLSREAGATDAVVTVDLTRYPYHEFYHTSYLPVDSLSVLREIEAQHTRTWLVYTFPIRLAVVEPEIWARIQEHYTLAANFPGTVGGGDIVVMRSK
ncbi:MAG: glycosyltransferase family 39 protein [Gemmatimonadota bacterium]